MRPLFIILEGPDCVGKTTLGKFMAKRFHATFFHLTAKGKLPEAMFDYQANVLENVETSLYEMDRGIVLDRFWPSEVVYGKIFRPHMEFNSEYFIQHTMRLGAIYIMCDHPDVEQRHADEQDPDHPYDPEKFQQVIRGYRELYDQMCSRGLDIIPYSIPMWGGNMNDFASIVLNRYHELSSKR